VCGSTPKPKKDIHEWIGGGETKSSKNLSFSLGVLV